MEKEYQYVKATGVRKELAAINQTLKGILKEMKKGNKSINHEKVINCRYAYCSKQPGECKCENERDTYKDYEGDETGRSFGI